MQIPVKIYALDQFVQPLLGSSISQTPFDTLVEPGFSTVRQPATASAHTQDPSLQHSLSSSFSPHPSLNQPRSPALNDHLRNPLPTKRFTPDKTLPLDTRERIKARGDKQEDGGGEQARCLGDQRDPLNGTHGQVDGGAHVVGLEAADEAVKGLRGRADAEE